MHVRAFRCAPAFLGLFSLAAAACDTGDGVVRAGGVTVPSAFDATRVTAVPAALAPQFVASSSCLVHPPFSTRLSLVVSAGQDLFLRVVRFELADGFGGRTLPTVVPVPTGARSIPTAIPLPPPTSAAIPIPGASAFFDGIFVSAGSARSLPFLLHFACGVPSAGMLFVDVETADRLGSVDLARVSVRVGG